MKANLKGGNALVRFLLAHGEKIGMAGIVVCAAMLIWSAIGRERLGDDQQPENLQSLITRADSHMKGFSWESATEEDKLIAQAVSNDSMKPIPRSQFPTYDHNFDRPVIDPIGLRTDPALLTVEELEVHGDAGLWAFADPEMIKTKKRQALAEQRRRDKEREERSTRGPDEEDDGGPRRSRGGGLYDGRPGAEGRTAKASRNGPIVQTSRSGAQLQGYEQVRADSWVTILGKVPVEKQYQLYDDALQNSRGYDRSRDIPKYRGYQVQRVEITDQGQGEWKVIATIREKEIRKALDTYPVDVQDVVDDRYKHSTLTHPLPPLILREWDERVSHSSMPLASAAQPEEVVEEEPAQEAEGETPEGEDLFGEAVAESDRGKARDTRRRGPPARGQARGGGRSRGYDIDLEMDPGAGALGAARSAGPTRQVGSSLKLYTWDGKTSHILFRYFDNSVTPGKKYRYRVRMALSDVNNISSEQYLDKSVTERRSKIKGSALEYRLSEWSKESPIVSVPLPARLYLISSEPAKENKFNSEPEVELLIEALNSQYAAKVHLTGSFLRGSVINLRDKATVVTANDFDPNGNPEFDFRTGITLLDFSGGDKLSNKNRNLTAPSRALLMDAAGRLFHQSELDDNEAVAEYQQIVEAAQNSRRSSRIPDDPGVGRRPERGR